MTLREAQCSDCLRVDIYLLNIHEGIQDMETNLYTWSTEQEVWVSSIYLLVALLSNRIPLHTDR